MDVVEQHEAEDRAKAGHRLEQRQGMGVMVLGGCDDGACDVAQQRIVGGDERTIHFDALVHRWIGTALGDSVSVRFVGNVCDDGREILLTVGMVDRGQECAAWAGQRHASTQQVAGRAPLGRRDRGLWKHTAAQQYGDCMGVDRIVFGLAAMDGLHGEGMTEDTRDPMCSTEVSKPVPGQQACGRQNDLIAVGGDGLEQRLWGGCHVPVQQRFTSLVEEAQGHGAGVEIDPTGKRVLLGVESHEVSSSL